MKNIIKKSLSIFLSLTIIFVFSSCSTSYEITNNDNFSVMTKAEIIGNLKGDVAVEGTFIEVCFPEKTTFDTVVLKEKDNQIDKFSIWIEDENGEYKSIYEQDRIGDYRYCEIGEYTADSIKICINSSNENQYNLKSIDVLNVKDNKNDDFRVTSYLVCQWFYGNENIDAKKLSTLTDIILFGVARFDENGNVYLQDLDINGEVVSGEVVFKDIIKNIKETNPNAKIYCNILGPDGSDSNDKEKLHSQAFKKNDKELINNILDLLKAYNFDGIFFDYEYPHHKHLAVEYPVCMQELPKGTRVDECVAAMVEYAGDLKGWFLEDDLVEKIQDTMNCTRAAYLQGSAVVLGSDNACFEKKIILRHEESGQLYQILPEWYYRPDVFHNLQEQINVALSGFACLVNMSQMPKGKYEVAVLAMDKISKQYLLRTTTRSFENL